MTESEAIKVLNMIVTHEPLSTMAKEMSIKALEKQIPKKPIFDFNSSDTLSKFHCDCGKIIWVHHDIVTMDNNDLLNYCDNCGQKLDWDE